MSLTVWFQERIAVHQGTEIMLIKKLHLSCMRVWLHTHVTLAMKPLIHSHVHVMKPVHGMGILLVVRVSKITIWPIQNDLFWIKCFWAEYWCLFNQNILILRGHPMSKWVNDGHNSMWKLQIEVYVYVPSSHSPDLEPLKSDIIRVHMVWV